MMNGIERHIYQCSSLALSYTGAKFIIKCKERVLLQNAAQFLKMQFYYSEVKNGLYFEMLLHNVEFLKNAT